jgi:peptidoglycan/LPS O-acetylase OafA/YrhL
LPVLLYAPIGLLKAQPGLTRRLLVAAVCVVAAWSVISSLRAGGDVWDNPRYRTLLLPWIALVVAWAWNFAREQRDGWLGRWYAVIGIFLLFFTNWYLYRIYNRGILIEFWTMIGLIGGLSLLVLGWGIYTEIKAHARSSPPSG